MQEDLHTIVNDCGEDGAIEALDHETGPDSSALAPVLD